MKVYLAGPMRGRPNLNHEAFAKAARWLRTAGHEVYSPAEQPHGTVTEGAELRASLADNLRWVCVNADAVVMLPGWKDSRGALAEGMAAQALGIPVTPFGEFLLEKSKGKPMVDRVVCNECLKKDIIRFASVLDLTMSVVGVDGTVREIRETKSLCDECLAPALVLERLMALPAAPKRSKRPRRAKPAKAAKAAGRPKRARRQGPPAGKHPLKSDDFETETGKALLAAKLHEGLTQL